MVDVIGGCFGIEEVRRVEIWVAELLEIGWLWASWLVFFVSAILLDVNDGWEVVCIDSSIDSSLNLRQA